MTAAATSIASTVGFETCFPVWRRGRAATHSTAKITPYLTFGEGEHRCPGEKLMLTTVRSVLRWLFSSRDGRGDRPRFRSV